jgi:hypothetical protein
MLKLAQLTEAAKHNIGEMDLDIAQPQTPHHMQQSSQSSGSSSDSASPAQSPFSSARYSRSSAASSVASSPAYRDSMDGYSAAKRPLTDVKEEPQREEDSHQVFPDHLFGTFSAGISSRLFSSCLHLPQARIWTFYATTPTWSLPPLGSLTPNLISQITYSLTRVSSSRTPV